MDKLNFALIGLGPVGEYNHLPALINYHKINLVSICDKNELKVKSLSKKYKVKGYTDFKKMIKDNIIDVIVLCSSLGSLFKISKYILNKKIDLFVEKPMCISFKQAEELHILSKINKVNYMVGYMKVYDPCMIKLKNILKKKNREQKIIKVDYLSFGGKAFEQKFMRSQKKFNFISQVNKNIRQKKKLS